MGALAATEAKKEGVLGKDEHCSAGRQCQPPPSLPSSVPLARLPALPLLLRRIKEQERGSRKEMLLLTQRQLSR